MKSTITDLEEYFKELRFNEKHHLGLGDIRLTISQQEDICKLVKKVDYLVPLLEQHFNHKYVQCPEVSDIEDIETRATQAKGFLDALEIIKNFTTNKYKFY